jgi:hypothetical protein
MKAVVSTLETFHMLLGMNADVSTLEIFHMFLGMKAVVSNLENFHMLLGMKAVISTLEIFHMLLGMQALLSTLEIFHMLLGMKAGPRTYAMTKFCMNFQSKAYFTVQVRKSEPITVGKFELQFLHMAIEVILFSANTKS